MEFTSYLGENNISIIGTIPETYTDSFIKNTVQDDKIIDLVFVIDTSGSMDSGLGNSFLKGNKYSKSKLVQNAVNKSIEYMKVLSDNKHQIRLSIISFKEYSETIIDKLMVTNNSTFNEYVSILTTKLSPTGGTDIYKALQHTDTLVQSILTTNSKDNINIIVMTDGHNNKSDENTSLVDFFKSLDYKDRFIGMGIGNVNDYDAVLLNNLFDNLKCSASGEELNDNIIAEAFGACSTVFTDFQIVFTNVDKNNFFSPIKLEFENNNAILNIKNIDFSQTLIFNINKTDIPVTMKVSYNNLISNSKYENTFNCNDGVLSPVFNSQIEIICKQMDRFNKIFVQNIPYNENLDITKNIIEEFAKIKDRTGKIGELCIANESIVKNHYNELLKYKDMKSYFNYSNLANKTVNTTVNVGKSPMILRSTSENVSRIYSTKSCPIPDDFEDLKQNKDSEYVQNTTLKI